MMALFLREIKKLKTEEVDKIIGEEYKELDFTMGSGVEHSRSILIRMMTDLIKLING